MALSIDHLIQENDDKGIKLKCLNCQQTQLLEFSHNYPMELKRFSKAIHLFIKDHKNCKPMERP